MEEEEVVVVVVVVAGAKEEEEQEEDTEEEKESSWPLSLGRSEQQRRSAVCREEQRRRSWRVCSVTFTQPARMERERGGESDPCRIAGVLPTAAAAAAATPHLQG